jgi:hypothetical protein
MIRITKNSIVEYPFHNTKEARFIDVDDLPQFLADEVVIGKNVTFGRIFELIIANKDIFNVIFNKGCLYGYRIDQFIDEFNKEDDDKDANNVDWIEVCWGVDYMDGFMDSEKELTIYPDFHGIKQNYVDKFIGDGKPCDMGIAVEFTPINQLKKYPFKLDKKVEIRGYDKDAENKFPILLEATKDFTLFDMIKGILHEITFMGAPEQRDEQRSKLDATVERIEKGEEKLYEMKIEDDKINFYDVDTGELHGSIDEDDDKESDCGCNGNCDCID